MGVIFVAVTGAAPISAMLFNVPISVGYGNGIGTPAGFLVRHRRPHHLRVGYVAMAAAHPPRPAASTASSRTASAVTSA